MRERHPFDDADVVVVVVVWRRRRNEQPVLDVARLPEVLRRRQEVSLVAPGRTRTKDPTPVPGHQSPGRTLEPRPGMLGLGAGERARQDVAAHVRRVDRRHRLAVAEEQA